MQYTRNMDLRATMAVEMPSLIDGLSFSFSLSGDTIFYDLMFKKIFSNLNNELIVKVLADAGIDQNRYAFSLSETEILCLCLSLHKFMN